MAKKNRTSFALDRVVLDLLALMAKKKNRSQANMIEVLVFEASEAFGITPEEAAAYVATLPKKPTKAAK